MKQLQLTYLIWSQLIYLTRRKTSEHTHIYANEHNDNCNAHKTSANVVHIPLDFTSYLKL